MRQPSSNNREWDFEVKAKPWGNSVFKHYFDVLGGLDFELVSLCDEYADGECGGVGDSLCVGLVHVQRALDLHGWFLALSEVGFKVRMFFFL